MFSSPLQNAQAIQKEGGRRTGGADGGGGKGEIHPSVTPSPSPPHHYYRLSSGAGLAKLSHEGVPVAGHGHLGERAGNGEHCQTAVLELRKLEPLRLLGGLRIERGGGVEMGARGASCRK